MRAAIAAAAAVSSAAASLPSPLVMPWLCLERCGDSASTISAEVAQFSAHRELNWASFEMYNLGPGSTLIKNNLTAVAAPLRAAGAATVAMVSSFPYPTNFVATMREVFAAPQPFIDAVIAACEREGLSGVNIDWEPPSNANPKATHADALAYAAFLDTLAAALQAHSPPLIASVDVATWSPIWDLQAIAATRVDAIFFMGTYTEGFALWQKVLAEAVADVGLEKLVVGLETTKATSGGPYNASELTLRFDALRAAGVRRVGLWDAPVPELWFPFLQAL